MLNTTEILTLAKSERLKDIISLCEKSLREEAAKIKGGASEVKRYKAALKIISESPKENLRNAYIEDGKQYFTDGFIAFELNNPIDNLPEGEDHLDIRQFFTANMAYYEQVEPFNIPELKFGLEIAKAEKRATKAKTLAFCKGGMYVNDNGKRKWGCAVENILKAIDILGDGCEVYLPENSVTAGIIKNENGRAIIMPIRLPDNA